jgi:hypothetical protein
MAPIALDSPVGAPSNSGAVSFAGAGCASVDASAAGAGGGAA